MVGVSGSGLPLKNGASIKNTGNVTKSAMTLSLDELRIGLKDGVTDTLRGGFKHTVADEYIKSVTFKLTHQGSNMGHTPVYLRTRKVSDNSILGEAVICYVDDESVGTHIEYTTIFDTPVYANCECYFLVEVALEAAWAESYMKVWGREAGGTQNGWYYDSLTPIWTQVPANHDVYGVIDYKHQWETEIDIIRLGD